MINGARTLRDRLYASYVTTHGARKDPQNESRLFKRDILPHLPSPLLFESAILDIGCGQGYLVQQLIAHGYHNSLGIDVSQEQVDLAHGAGISNVIYGDYRDVLVHSGTRFDAVIATDVIEHFTKHEVLETFGLVFDALAESGVFIVRCPNGVSPFVGNYQYGDMTHETLFTPRSFRQVAAEAGFTGISVHSCNPIVHGASSAGRAIIWRGAASLLKLVLVAETGEIQHIVTQNFVGVARRRPCT